MSNNLSDTEKHHAFIADVRKRILGMAQDSAEKTSKVYQSKHDQELCSHEFYKGAMWFAQKLEELKYDGFSGQWIIKGEHKKMAVADSTENA